MKVKTDNLIGAQLDWAVAKAQGHNVAFYSEAGFVAIRRNNVIEYFNPSVNWSWAGPIVDSALLVVRRHEYSEWRTSIWQACDGTTSGHGPTPLVAAMRCYVKMKLGHTVEVPDETCK